MVTRIRKLAAGKEYYLPAIKCNVLVVELYNYDYCFADYNTSSIIPVNERLYKELGDDFRAIYYQAQILITKSYRLKKNREYEKGSIEVMEWGDLQNATEPKK